MLAALGQSALLMIVLFRPDVPRDILSIADQFGESHWTDGLENWWLALSAASGLCALLGLVADKHRDVAATALAVAFIGVVWPWGV